MAETTLQLGFVPKERGEYTSGATYYKDNVVQYNGSSYIADPVGWSEDDPTDTYVTIAPTDASGNLNAGWRIFASGNNTFTTGEKVDNVGIDDEPTAGSDNLVKSGGIQDNLSHINENVFSYKSLQQYTGWVNKNPIQLNDYGAAKYVVLRVNPEDLLTIEAVTSGRFVILKSFDFEPSLPYSFDLATGETNVRTSFNGTLPSDAHYVILQYCDNYNTVFNYPTIKLNGIDIKTTIFEQLNKKVGVTTQSFTDEEKAQALANLGISGFDSTPALNSEKLVRSGGIKQGILNERLNAVGYYTCSTARGTAQKTIDNANFELQEGGCIKVLFTADNNTDSPTLKVGNSDAKPIYYNDQPANKVNKWSANEVVEFYYDGTYWRGQKACYLANLGYVLVIGSGNFEYNSSTKTLSIPDTFDIVGAGYSKRISNYSGGNITFTNQGTREQLLIFNDATNSFVTANADGSTSTRKSSYNIILGSVDVTTGKEYFNFEYIKDGLSVIRNDYDSEPTLGSQKLVRSGAIKEALDSIGVNNLISLMAHGAHFRKIDLEEFVYEYFDNKYDSVENNEYTTFLSKIQARKTTGIYQIALITDTHEGGQYASKNRKYAFRCINILNKLASYVDICAHGGDISCDYGTSLERYFAYLQEAISQYKIPTAKNFLITKGNHDTKDKNYSEVSPLDVDWENGSYLVSPAFNVFQSVTKDTYRGGELYIEQTKQMTDSAFRFIQSQNVPTDANWGNGAYYYYDVADYKIRFIVANSFPVKDDGSSGVTDEYQWFMQTALNLSAKDTPTDWLVVCIRHTESTSLEPFTAIISAFMSGSSVTTSGVTVDFGDINGGGLKFIHLHGHEHETAGYSNMAGYLDIGFRQGNVSKSNLGDVSKYNVYVISIDTENHKMISDCLNADETINYDYANNIVEINISQSILMARSGFSSQTKATWVSSDASIATVGEHTGIVTGVSAGTVTITGTEGTLVRTYTVKVVS